MTVNGDSTKSFIAACSTGKLDLARNLIETSAESPTKLLKSRDEDRRTPLHWAVSGGHLPMVEYLVGELKADVNVADEDGWTPLLIASSIGASAIAAVLLEGGANVDTQNDSGNVGLHYCASKNHLECSKILLKYGANCSILNKLGQSIVHRACSKGNIQFMRDLEKARPSEYSGLVAVRDKFGNNALHLACEEDLGDMAVFLLQANGDMWHVENKEGRKPLDLCSAPVRKFIEHHLQN
eukprot:Partr_v1_DN28748_c5_g1_i5_m61982 putative Proteasome (Prosome, macropain) 26S subunit, non-ATPase, 10